MIRPSKIADQRRRIGRVIAHIEANSQRKLTLKELASVACLSLHHFLRLYVDLVGETPMDTVRRLRLGEVGEALAAGTIDIASAARRSGYGSSQAFGRAFRRQFGVAPSQVRDGKVPLSLEQGADMAPRLVELAPQFAVGLRYRGMAAKLAEPLDQVAVSVLAAGVPLRRLAMGWLQHDRSDRSAHARIDVDLCVAGHPALLVDVKLHALTLPGGRYLQIRHFHGHETGGEDWAAQADRAAHKLGVSLGSGPIRRVYAGDPMLTLRRDAISDFYLPLAA